MNLAELNKIAMAMVAPGRGILAADESSGTIKKRAMMNSLATRGQWKQDLEKKAA